VVEFGPVEGARSSVLQRPDAFSGTIYLQQPRTPVERQASGGMPDSGWVMPTAGDKVWPAEGWFAVRQRFVDADVAVAVQAAVPVLLLVLRGSLPFHCNRLAWRAHCSCLCQAKRSASSFSSIGSMMRTGLGGLGLRSKSSPAVRCCGVA